MVKASKIGSKSALARVLSGLEVFYEPKVRHEQYPTDGEIGAAVLWNALLLGDIEGKVIADLGCGTGILGIGALLLGAKSAYFIDIDEKALEIAKKNVLKVKSETSHIGEAAILNKEISKAISEESVQADVVVQNPPFGTKVRHNDIFFLENALKLAPVIYSFHKSETLAYLERFCGKNNAEVTHIWSFKFPLKASFGFHRRQIHRIDVSCIRVKRKY